MRIQRINIPLNTYIMQEPSDNPMFEEDKYGSMEYPQSEKNTDKSNSQYDPLNIYLNSISKFSKINKQEEIILAKKIQKGGEEGEQARLKLIKANLMLVVDRALKRYQKLHKLDIMDYIQEGNVGLSAAAEKYDGRNAFSTFATFYIDGYLKTAENIQFNLIRLPVYLNIMLNYLSTESTDLKSKLRRKPTLEELSKKTNIAVKKLKKYQAAQIKVESLYKKISDNCELIDLTENNKSPSPAKIVEKKEAFEYAKRLLSLLNARTQKIIILKFGLFGNNPHTLKEIANKYKISSQRVSEIILESLAILKQKSPLSLEFADNKKIKNNQLYKI